MAAPDDAVAAYAGKWWQREPEMRVVPAFAPVAQRPLLEAWGALLHELREAAFELSDERVTTAKCGWWAEELDGWHKGRHRHPLGRELHAQAAPWSALGRAWLAMADADARNDDTEAAIASLAAPARAVADVEAALFADASRPVDATAMARTIAIHWLAMRLPQGLAAPDRGRVPLHLVARHGQQALEGPGPAHSALLRDWTGELRERLPAREAGPLFRRCRTAFDRARLARAGQGGEPAALATLWRAWRAARAG